MVQLLSGSSGLHTLRHKSVTHCAAVACVCLFAVVDMLWFSSCHHAECMCRYVEGSVGFLSGLVSAAEMVPLARQHRDRMLTKVCCAHAAALAKLSKLQPGIVTVPVRC